jgi:hypothetical protein
MFNIIFIISVEKGSKQTEKSGFFLLISFYLHFCADLRQQFFISLHFTFMLLFYFFAFAALMKIDGE